MSSPAEAIIEQAIETLHSLMDVLTKLDENLKALSIDVHEAELAIQEVEAANGGASSMRNSVKRATIRKSQAPTETNLDATSDAGAGAERNSVKRSTVRKSQVKSQRNTVANTEEAGPDPVATPDAPAATPAEADETSKSARPSVRGSVRKSTIVERPTEAGTPDERASKFSASTRASTIQNEEASAPREAVRDSISGRLTRFLGQFDHYVSDISEKIETLQGRVDSLGKNDDEEPKS